MALNWVRLGRAPGHGNGAKGRLTDWLHGWFDLVFILPPHLIFSHLYSLVWLRGREHCVCVCAHSVSISVHMCFYIRIWISDCGSPWLFIGFQHVSLCRRSSSLRLLLILWRAHVILNRCSCSVWKQCCYTATPKLSSVFEHSWKKTSASALPFENCSLMNKTHIATPVHFAPFLLFSFPFLFSFSLLGTPPSVNLGKLRGTPPCFFCFFFMCKANGLSWLVMKLNALTGSCMYGNENQSRAVRLQVLFVVAVKLECFIFGKVSCWCMCVRACSYSSACACVRMNRSSGLWCSWKSEGRCRSIGCLCMTLMNTLIGPHEDRPDCDRLICVYCALWLDERGHDDGCHPLWQGCRVFSEMCYLMKCSSMLVDRNILNRARTMSPIYPSITVRHLYSVNYISIWALFLFWLLSKLLVLKFLP